MKRSPNPWTNKKDIHNAFDKLFDRFSDSILVISYRSDGIPSIEEVISILRKYKSKITTEVFGQYKYVLSNNGKSKEVLIIAE